MAVGAVSGCGVGQALRPRPTALPKVSISPTAAASPTRLPAAATPRAAATPTQLATETPSSRQATPASTATTLALATAVATSTPKPSPTVPTGPAISVSRIKTNDNVVTLTFDAGADRGKADQLLVYLESVGIHVTFGMTGRWAETNPDLVREIAVQGHDFMNHTYDHRSWTGLSAKPAVLTPKDRAAELWKTETILQDLAGVNPRPLFRPPYGDENASVLRDAGEAGYHYSILWTVDSTGWERAPIKQIVDRCLGKVVTGAIYVMHVGVESLDIDALPQVVDGLQAKGYRFATLRALLAANPENG